MTNAIQRLHEGVRAMLMAHFLAMPASDRYLRFGRSLAPGVIADYVDGIDFGRDAVFAVRDERLVLVGVAHVSFEDDRAEVGLSVLPTHRRRGLGGALFERAAAHARNRGIPGLIMRCLAGNVPIMRIARRFGMSIVTSAGDADARLELPPPSVASRAGEFVTDSLALYERMLETLAGAWKYRGDRSTPAA